VTDKRSGSSAADDLRRRAEEMDRELAAKEPQDPSPELSRSLFHELRVHQIELEMQNEELRRAQEALEASRARYFDLFDLAPVGYLTLDEHGRVLEANLTAATLLGVERQRLVKQPLTRFILQEDQDVYYLRRKRLFETDVPQVFELRMLRGAASSFWARLEATVARDGESEGPVCRAVVSDVSERRRAEEERAKTEDRDRQLQKAESLGRMAGAIAHEFNNLLQVVLGNIELALRDRSGDADLVKNLTRATQAVTEAAGIIGRTLTYIGYGPSQQGPLQLSEACQHGLEMLRAIIPTGVVLETDLQSPGPVINADADQMQQALSNLVTNAIEAVGEGGGTVRVNVRTALPAEIAVAHRFPVDWQAGDGSYACLEVTDTGCGIAAQDVEKLFDPFFSSKFIGRGLGLPVVLGIARSHHGVVAVESEPGSGSVFRLFLPQLAERIADRPARRATRSAEIEGGGVMLLVEDGDRVRRVTAAMLARLGLGVLEARDGVEALEVFRQNRESISCVLCDLTMPRMNGWDTMAALRQLAPALPVILVTGYDVTREVTERCERPQAFLIKPYSLQLLREAIGQALAGSKESEAR
jgi:two-component system, cell cycle sensor histidine kinase and response regulator CckA